MQEKETSQQLLDLDEKGKALKTSEKKEQKPAQENLTYILIVFLAVVVSCLAVKIFLFPNEMKKHVFPNDYLNANDVNQAAGDLIMKLVKKKPNAKIGLGSGSSVKGLYEYIVSKYKKKNISFKKVQFYSLDGFCGVPKKDVNSYYHTLTTNFLSKIDADEKNYHLINEEVADPTEENCEKEAEKYNNELLKNQLDLQILGYGENGHFGFNQPGTLFDTQTRAVEMDEETRKDKAKLFGSLDKTPKYAITQGISNVLNAKEVVVIGLGEKKADAMKVLLDGEPTVNCPVSALKTHQGKVVVYGDREAMSKRK